jgi:hypothetical protein
MLGLGDRANDRRPHPGPVAQGAGARLLNIIAPSGGGAQAAVQAQHNAATAACIRAHFHPNRNSRNSGR